MSLPQRAVQSTDYATISRKIWLDPEFTGLTVDAQLLYFYRKTTRQRSHFSAIEMASIFKCDTPRRVEEAARLLTHTKYGYSLKKAVVRADIPLALRRAVFAHDGWACVYCGSKRKLELDHIQPISKGGTDDRANLQTLCQSCNRRKGANV